MPLDLEQVALVKGLLARGEKQHDVAAFFGVNGGRIAEIAKGHKHPDIKPAPRKDLPSQSDMASSFGVHLARQAIKRAKLGLEAALSFLDEYDSKR